MKSRSTRKENNWGSGETSNSKAKGNQLQPFIRKLIEYLMQIWTVHASEMVGTSPHNGDSNSVNVDIYTIT